VTLDFWRRRKVLVTGGCGFIGSHLVRRLVRLGARVSVADSLVRGSLTNLSDGPDSVQLTWCDLTDQKACLKVCANVDTVFHLASRVGGISYYLQRPGEVITDNVMMDALMLRAALACGVERYVYASSAHVYPIGCQLTPDAPPMREDHALPAEPHLSYGWAKLIAEKQLEYLVEEGVPIRAAILRLAGVYGENQDADLEGGSAIPVFIRRAIEYPKRKPFVILGTGQETRSYCYVEDVVDALLLAGQKLEERCILGPLNIGSEERIKIQDLAGEIVAISGKEIEVVNDLSHPTSIWAQIPDCSRASEELDGWRPKTPLRDGLTRVYRHMLSKLGEVASPVPETVGRSHDRPDAS
jgi:nucleoside-diphosphate-sugar epimerase